VVAKQAIESRAGHVIPVTVGSCQRFLTRPARDIAVIGMKARRIDELDEPQELKQLSRTYRQRFRKTRRRRFGMNDDDRSAP
jgi:hypothetical protein